MASLKEIKGRIGSVKNTLKITSAMKMISSAKLHKAQGAITGMQPYSDKLTGMLDALLQGNRHPSSPYAAERPVKRVAIVAVSSSTSLCGGFNTNIIRQTIQTIEECRTSGAKEIILYPIGRKIAQAAPNMEGVIVRDDYTTIGEKPVYANIATMAGHLMTLYAEKRVDKVVLVYAHYKNMTVQEMMHETYLPISHERKEDSATGLPVEYIIEPSPTKLLEELIPRCLSIRFFAAILDASAAEHAARTFAMQQATDNGNTLLQELNLQYNKGRQQAITNELQDIIGGSLK